MCLAGKLTSSLPPRGYTRSADTTTPTYGLRVSLTTKKKITQSIFFFFFSWSRSYFMLALSLLMLCVATRPNLFFFCIVRNLLSAMEKKIAGHRGGGAPKYPTDIFAEKNRDLACSLCTWSTTVNWFINITGAYNYLPFSRKYSSGIVRRHKRR